MTLAYIDFYLFIYMHVYLFLKICCIIPHVIIVHTNLIFKQNLLGSTSVSTVYSLLAPVIKLCYVVLCLCVCILHLFIFLFMFRFICYFLDDWKFKREVLAVIFATIQLSYCCFYIDVGVIVYTYINRQAKKKKKKETFIGLL